MKTLLVAMFAVATVGVAYAGALQDTEALENGDKMTQESAKRVAEEGNCGGPVTAKIDKASFKADGTANVSQYCANAVDGVSGVCQLMPTHKKDILKAVKTVTCHYDAKVTENHAVKVVKKGTNVDVYFNKDSANVQTFVGEYLQKNL